MIKTNINTQDRRVQVSVKKIKRILLGIDAHADSYRVVRQIDGATPQPAQKFTLAGLLKWAAKQLELAEEVYSCYEAGPMGYGLHRQLEALGVKNVVICPQNWDERRKGVKTDKTDALAICQHLAQYVGGNLKALAVIRIPTPEEEQRRAQSRQREQMRKARQQLEAQGRSLLLYNGYRVKGRWWYNTNWEVLSPQWPSGLVALLEIWRKHLIELDKTVKEITKAIESVAKAQPKGFGALSSELISREIGNWNRFDNRRQVSSYTGLCPSVTSSGLKSMNGNITKHGNRRLRRVLVVAAWRLVKYQPNYRAIQRWRDVFAVKGVKVSQRKKAIVAVARHLAIDLWRIHTGRMTPQQVGLDFVQN